MNTTGGQTHPHHVEVEVRAEPRQLPWLRDRLERWLRHITCPDDGVERALLALNEAITNSMVHGYRDGPPGPLRVVGQHRGDEVVLTVADKGSWKPARPGEGLGGRGVLMMQECVDRVYIEHTSDGTDVTLELDVAHGQASGRNKGEHRIAVRSSADEVIVRITGNVPADAAALLRRQLLGASCGGVVPLMLDLSALGPVVDGASLAIKEIADAVAGVGGKVVLVIPPESLAAAELGIFPGHELVDVVESL
ncbi:ATP-binding protein [Haloechinothrix halophila]|uniref:ATP-binding protein n=1 Tax=Haloechinothrix halophila TaxID=1069073 RepID=UPI0004186DF3|nr:ATP-binding protein [Haloechinothrix halophila]